MPTVVSIKAYKCHQTILELSSWISWLPITKIQNVESIKAHGYCRVSRCRFWTHFVHIFGAGAPQLELDVWQTVWTNVDNLTDRRWAHRGPAIGPSLTNLDHQQIQVTIHKYTNTQIHKYTNTQIHKYRGPAIGPSLTNLDHPQIQVTIHKYTNTQIHEFIHKYTNTDRNTESLPLGLTYKSWSSTNPDDNPQIQYLKYKIRVQQHKIWIKDIPTRQAIWQIQIQIQIQLPIHAVRYM